MARAYLYVFCSYAIHVTVNGPCACAPIANHILQVDVTDDVTLPYCLYHVASGDVRKRTVIRRIFGIRGRTADLS